MESILIIDFRGIRLWREHDKACTTISIRHIEDSKQVILDSTTDKLVLSMSSQFGGSELIALGLSKSDNSLGIIFKVLVDDKIEDLKFISNYQLLLIHREKIVVFDIEKKKQIKIVRMFSPYLDSTIV